MANNYYYYGPMDPDGKGGLGLILLFIFGIINSLISQCFGSWSNFFLVAGLTIVAASGLCLMIKAIRWLYKKRCQTLQKRMDGEKAKSSKS